MELYYSGFSDIGKVAPIMEDFINVFDINNIKFTCIADGMGGKKGSNIASNIAIYELKEYLEKNNYFDLQSLDVYMNSALYFINRMLMVFQEANPKVYNSFSTTFTIVATDSYGNAKIYHAGNTRAYLLREGELYQLTKDDTVAQKKLDEGKIKPDELQQHPERGFLTNVLGSEEFKFNSFSGNFMINDTLILMTNGVYEVLSQNDLMDLLKAFSDKTLDELCKTIIKSVNEISGIDNSAIIISIFK